MPEVYVAIGFRATKARSLRLRVNVRLELPQLAETLRERAMAQVAQMAQTEYFNEESPIIAHVGNSWSSYRPGRMPVSIDPFGIQGRQRSTEPGSDLDNHHRK